MRFRSSAIAIAVAAALPAIASAADLSYSAFATAGYAETDTDLAEYGYVGMPEGVTSEGSYEYDSKFGLQLTATFNDMLSATVQGVAYTDLTSKWAPRLDWGYLKFQPISSLNARIGYMRAPTFMFSDSVFIGYANAWVRPPLEVYNLAPAYQLRGIDTTWSKQLGSGNYSLQLFYGDGDTKIGATEQSLKSKDWYGAVASATYGSFTVRGSYSTMTMDTTSDRLVSLIDMLRAVPPALCDVCAVEADRLDLKGDTFTLGEAGIQYDDGSNVLVAEYASRQSEQSYTLPDLHAVYATVGHRFGGLMPFASYAIARREGITESQIPAVPGTPLPLLAAGTNQVLAANNSQDTYSAGLRYELPGFSVVNGALLKLQYDHTEIKEGNGMFLNVQPGFEDEVSMYSLSVDFIF